MVGTEVGSVGGWAAGYQIHAVSQCYDTTPCHAVLYHAVLYYSTLNCATLDHTVLCYAMLYCTVLYYTLCHTIGKRLAILCCTTL